MFNLLGPSLSILILIFGALNGALMLASPATYRRLSFRIAYWPYRILHRSAEIPVASGARGPDFLYRLQGLGIFTAFSFGAGLMFKMLMREARQATPASVATLPHAVRTGGIWSSIFLGLIFIATGVLLLVKPEIGQYWTEMRMGKLEPKPTRKNLRIGSGILALCLFAFGLLAIWFGARCVVTACQ
jgi:hypothetical protein